MSETAQKEIRRLLKEFGIGADEAVVAHLTANPGIESLSIRLQLVDETDYGGSPPATPLDFRVAGMVHREG